MQTPVIALPGGVSPAALRYQPVAGALPPIIDLHLKELEVYAGAEPPPGYSIEGEVAGLVRFADELGLERFHLLGYSAGGFVSLAFAGCHPGRLLSLAVFEPAAVPGEPTAEERAQEEVLRRELDGLRGGEFMRAFMQLQVRPGVALEPPAGPPPDWMRNRPAGLTAVMSAFREYLFDRERFR